MSNFLTNDTYQRVIQKNVIHVLKTKAIKIYLLSTYLSILYYGIAD